MPRSPVKKETSNKGNRRGDKNDEGDKRKKRVRIADALARNMEIQEETDQEESAGEEST